MNGHRSLVLGFVLAILAAGAVAVAVPWGIPPELWTTQRLTVYVGSQKLDVVRNPGNGMAGLNSLGSLDGMLFELPATVAPEDGGWQMYGVNRPLEIAYFAPSGELIGIERMDPCSAEPCPVYQPLAPYRWVIETDVGVLMAAPGDRLRVP